MAHGPNRRTLRCAPRCGTEHRTGKDRLCPEYSLSLIHIYRLAFGLSQIACLLDPELFVIGGGLSVSADSFIDIVRERYKRYARCV